MKFLLRYPEQSVELFLSEGKVQDQQWNRFFEVPTISQLPNLFGGTLRICNCILLLIVWVCSFSKRLPSMTFAEERVLIFLILRKNAKIVQP